MGWSDVWAFAVSLVQLVEDIFIEYLWEVFSTLLSRHDIPIHRCVGFSPLVIVKNALVLGHDFVLHWYACYK